MGGAKNFGMSLETREIKLFGRDIPGFCWDIPGAPEKFGKKSLCSIFGPYPFARYSRKAASRSKSQRVKPLGAPGQPPQKELKMSLRKAPGESKTDDVLNPERFGQDKRQNFFGINSLTPNPNTPVLDPRRNSAAKGAGRERGP